MGSEMCIRDRGTAAQSAVQKYANSKGVPHLLLSTGANKWNQPKACLLYTSDAADERSSVDLGGRRIIKKKKSEKQSKRGMDT